jgi:hypothetical protein
MDSDSRLGHTYMHFQGQEHSSSSPDPTFKLQAPTWMKDAQRSIDAPVSRSLLTA